MLGEHGDSQYPYLERRHVAGIPLAQFPGYSKEMVDEVVNATRFGGAEVIKLKGGTFYAVAPMIVELIKAIQRRRAPGAARLDAAERRVPRHAARWRCRCRA